MLSNDKRELNTYFDSDDYEKLCIFFKKIWSSKASYKVIMARRGFNLNYLFIKELKARYNENYNVDDIISNTALLFQAKEIADYYRIMKEFPEILIVDDILIHGRGIAKLIFDFEKLVIDYLEDTNFIIDYETVHKDLLSAINIYVFAQSEKGILLDNSYAVMSDKILSDKNLIILSQQISRALQQFDIANTSYVLSAELPWSFCREELERDNYFNRNTFFQYRGNTLKYYYKEEGNILETIRFYYSYKTRSYKRIATSLTIFDIPSKNDEFDDLCGWVAQQILNIIPGSRLASLFLLPKKGLARPKAQLLSFLLSILSYIEFFREKISNDSEYIYLGLIRSDYLKIASNFDKLKMIRFEILRLFEYFSESEEVKNSFFMEVQKYTEKNNENLNTEWNENLFQVGKSCESEYSNEHVSDIHEIAENIFYEIGLDAEYEAYQCQKGNIYLDIKNRSSCECLDTIRLDQYYSYMRLYEILDSESIGVLLNLMDSGLLAMNMEFDSFNQNIQCVLKAGELSTFVIPRRLMVFIPALSLVESAVFDSSINVKDIIEEFIEYLYRRIYNQFFSDDGEVNQDHIEDMDLLESATAQLLDIYDVGKNIQDWDISLLTEEEYFSHGIDELGNYSGMMQKEWMIEINDKIQYYKLFAQEFLRLMGK